MISKEEAKELLDKFYLQGELPDEELSGLNEYAKKTTYQALIDEMKQEPKYEKIMPTIEWYRGIMKDKENAQVLKRPPT
jgi:hypothetical protein